MEKLCINCNEFCNDESDKTYKECGGSYCKKYMRMTGINCKCVGDLYDPSKLSIMTPTPPIMITNYRARCCGTCRHHKTSPKIGYCECELSEDKHNNYSICMSYEMEKC